MVSIGKDLSGGEWANNGKNTLQRSEFSGTGSAQVEGVPIIDRNILPQLRKEKPTFSTKAEQVPWRESVGT